MKSTETARERSQRLSGAPPLPSPGAAPAPEQRLAPVPGEAMASEEYAEASRTMSALADRQRVLEQDLDEAKADIQELRTLLESVPALVDRATRLVTVLEEAHAAYSSKKAKPARPPKKSPRKK